MFFKIYDNISKAYKPLFPLLAHLGLCRLHIKSQTQHHRFIALATFLEPKKSCRNYVEAGTIKGKNFF